MKKLLLIGLVLILSSYIVMGDCPPSLNKKVYNKGETATMSAACSLVNEKNKAYAANWINMTGVVELEVDTGTTPNSVGEIFTEEFTIPSDYSGSSINVSLIVNGVNKGSVNATVTTAGTNELLITDCLVAGNWLGLTSSIKCTVTDENSKKISGGNCKVSVWNNDATQMLEEGITQLYDGELKSSWKLDYENFDESVDYKVKSICFCGTNSSINECIDEDGNSVVNSVGITISAFTTNTWITIREDPMPITYANGIDYPNAVFFAGFGESAFFRANFSNNRGEDVELEILTFLINNETGAIHQEPDGGHRTIQVPGGNVSSVGMHELTKDAQTGVYYIKKFFDVIFNNIVVAQGVINTESFNIIGTDDSFKLNNVVIDKINYYTGEFVHICANVTSLYNKRIEFDVLYNIRCSESGLDIDLERSLVGVHKEFRGLSANKTQMQCAEVFLDYLDHLKYKTSICYASITLESQYIDSFDNKLSKVSSTFNVTDYSYYPEYELNPTYPLIRLFPDWRRFDDVIDNVNRSYYRAKINISKLREDWLDPDDIIVDNDWDVYVICTEKMPISQEHYNFTVLDINGNVVDNEIEAKALQWVNGNGVVQSRCAIGIENINFSAGDDYFEIRIWYEDFEERSTEALEGIENKTGIFHLDVDCPSRVSSNVVDMGCTITAYIENDEVEKETDFTCYIDNGISTLTFDKWVTRIPWSEEKLFYVGDIDIGPHTLTCTGGLYNFGSLSQTVSDSFSLYSDGFVSGGGGDSIGEEIQLLDKMKEFVYDNFSLVFLAVSILIYFIVINSRMDKAEEEARWR